MSNSSFLHPIICYQPWAHVIGCAIWSPFFNHSFYMEQPGVPQPCELFLLRVGAVTRLAIPSGHGCPTGAPWQLGMASVSSVGWMVVDVKPWEPHFVGSNYAYWWRKMVDKALKRVFITKKVKTVKGEPKQYRKYPQTMLFEPLLSLYVHFGVCSPLFIHLFLIMFASLLIQIWSKQRKMTSKRCGMIQKWSPKLMSRRSNEWMNTSFTTSFTTVYHGLPRFTC